MKTFVEKLAFCCTALYGSDRWLPALLTYLGVSDGFVDSIIRLKVLVCVCTLLLLNRRYRGSNNLARLRLYFDREVVQNQTFDVLIVMLQIYNMTTSSLFLLPLFGRCFRLLLDHFKVGMEVKLLF